MSHSFRQVRWISTYWNKFAYTNSVALITRGCLYGTVPQSVNINPCRFVFARVISIWQTENMLKEMRHIEMPKAAPPQKKSSFVIFKTLDKLLMFDL